MNRRHLLVIAAVFVTAATILAVSGGVRVTVGGLRLSARSPLAATIAALTAASAWWCLARRQRAVAGDLEAAWAAIERHATRAIGVVALTAAIVAAVFATRSAAGADASGYLSEADVLSRIDLFHRDRLFPYADNGWLTTPLGWMPVGAGYQVPTYPPGLPLLMALPHAIAGIDGATAVIVASAAIAVWATGMIAGGVAGLLAAALLAFTPVFLYQSVQPMSDVPVTAAWMLCFVLLVSKTPRPWLAGVACGIAVLIRPNLAPLAVVPLALANRRLLFAAPVAVAGVLLAMLQWVLYGSPLRSGYGTADQLFALANIVPNLSRYALWLVTTAPLLVLAPLDVMSSLALAVFAALVTAAYLVYAVFDHWSYLRFLLPAIAVLAVFTGSVVKGWLRRLPVAARAPALLVLLLAASAHGISTARSRDTFQLGEQWHRVEQVAHEILQMEPTAVILSGEQSGAMRYYTGRSILRWDAATAGELVSAVTELANSGYPVYVALDAWEEEPFRVKLRGAPELALDWPAAVDAGTTHRTKLWRLADRDRFRRGEKVATTRLP